MGLAHGFLGVHIYYVNWIAPIYLLIASLKELGSTDDEARFPFDKAMVITPQKAMFIHVPQNYFIIIIIVVVTNFPGTELKKLGSLVCSSLHPF